MMIGAVPPVPSAGFSASDAVSDTKAPADSDSFSALLFMLLKVVPPEITLAQSQSDADIVSDVAPRQSLVQDQSANQILPAVGSDEKSQESSSLLAPAAEPVSALAVYSFLPTLTSPADQDANAEPHLAQTTNATSQNSSTATCASPEMLGAAALFLKIDPQSASLNGESGGSGRTAAESTRAGAGTAADAIRSEEHTSELQSRFGISDA